MRPETGLFSYRQAEARHGLNKYHRRKALVTQCFFVFEKRIIKKLRNPIDL